MKKNLFFSAIAVILLSSFTLNRQSKNLKETHNTNLIQGEYVTILGPDLIEPNAMVKVTVEYKATSSREINVFLQSTSNWEKPLEKSISVSAGSGTLTFEFKVPRLPDSNKGYRWGSFVSSGGGYQGKVSDEAFVNEVSIKRIKKKKEKKEN